MLLMQQPENTSALWHAWFDGASVPNPGKMGVGIVLVAPDGMRTEQSLALNHCGCNNEAELRALALVLDMARLAGVKAIEIRGDSKTAVDWVNGFDTTKIEPLAELAATIRCQLKTFGSASVMWVPRHRNEDADRLSRRALGLSEAKPPAKTGRRKRR